MGDTGDFEPLDDWEVEAAVLHALQSAKKLLHEEGEPTDPMFYSAAVTAAADQTAASPEPVDSASMTAAPAVNDNQTCLCVSCTCTGCHESCFRNCTGCGNPTDSCNGYQAEGEKRLPQCQKENARNADADATTEKSAAQMCEEQSEETKTTQVAVNGATETHRVQAVPLQNEPAQDIVAGAPSIPAFDFSALGDMAEQAAEADAQFNLHYGRAQDEYLAACIYMARIHALTAKAGRYGGGTWTAWYQSKGISEGSARTMVQNGVGFKSATLADLKNLPVLTKKDLNLIARNGAAEQVIQAAGEEDSAQVRNILTQLKTAQAERDAEREAKEKAQQEAAQAKQDAALDRKEREDAHAAAMRYKFECDRRAQDQKRVEELLEHQKQLTAKAQQDARGWEEAGMQTQEIVEDLQGQLAEKNARIKELESGQVIEATAIDQTEIDRRVQQALEEQTAQNQIDMTQQIKIVSQAVRGFLDNLHSAIGPREIAFDEYTALDQLTDMLQSFYNDFYDLMERDSGNEQE